MQKEKSSISHIINCSLLIIIVAITLLSLIRAIFKPEDIEQYENRYANKVPPLTLTSYLDGSFQTGMEDALGDQVFLSTTAKKYYNLIDTNISVHSVLGLLKKEDHYAKYKDIYLFNDCLTHSPRPLSGEKEHLDKRIKNINDVIDENPALDFMFIM